MKFEKSKPNSDFYVLRFSLWLYTSYLLIVLLRDYENSYFVGAVSYNCLALHFSAEETPVALGSASFATTVNG